MKKLMELIVIAALFVFPFYAEAGIIGNVNLKEYYTAPTGSVTFPSGSGNYYLDYDVSLNGGPLTEAFCVEDSDGPGSAGRPYTLLSIDASLAGFNLDPNRYKAAAWIAENYYNKQLNQETWKAAAQIAVWEVIFDYGNGPLNLGIGTFKSYATSYNAIAASILASLPTNPGNSATWALAVSPTVQQVGPISSEKYQNYLVRHPVPEPATMFLLGTGLIGLAGFGRKRLLKK